MLGHATEHLACTEMSQAAPNFRADKAPTRLTFRASAIAKDIYQYSFCALARADKIESIK
jgi:hypothetical protein